MQRDEDAVKGQGTERDRRSCAEAALVHIAVSFHGEIGAKKATGDIEGMVR